MTEASYQFVRPLCSLRQLVAGQTLLTLFSSLTAGLLVHYLGKRLCSLLWHGNGYNNSTLNVAISTWAGLQLPWDGIAPLFNVNSTSWNGCVDYCWLEM